MENSLFLAQLIGCVFTVIGLSILMNTKDSLKMMQDMMKNAGLMYLAGFMALVMGLLIVLTHNIWEGGWVILITVLGWLSLVKGVFLLLFPKWVMGMKQSVCTTGWMIFAWILCLGIGLYLMNIGFAWGIV